MNQVTTRLLVVLLAQHQYGVDLHHVTRVVHAVHVTPLPGAPDVILGAINLQGNVIPALSLRKRFGLPDKPLGLSDRFVITTSQNRTVALLVDDIRGIIQRPASDLADMDKAIIPMGNLTGALQTGEGLVLIYDLGAVLSKEEEQQLERAIARQPIA